jgi:hypothetical protein
MMGWLDTSYPLSQALLFILIFGVAGILCGFITDKVLWRARQIYNDITIFAFIHILIYAPVRVYQSIHNYHTVFREGLWVILWAIFFALGIRLYFQVVTWRKNIQ